MFKRKPKDVNIICYSQKEFSDIQSYLFIKNYQWSFGGKDILICNQKYPILIINLRDTYNLIYHDNGNIVNFHFFNTQNAKFILRNKKLKNLKKLSNVKKILASKT